MSSANRWILDPGCLRRALTRWRSTSPDATTRSRVYDRLIDLSENPLRLGREDEDHPGIWQVRVQGADITIIFIIIVENRSVCVVSIFEND